MSLLAEILEHKRGEVEAAKRRSSPAEMARRAEATGDRPLGFRRALSEGLRPRIVAELKRRSPSRGEIRPDFDPLAIARAYEQAGAAALSVLTDERYFGGGLSILEAVRRESGLPLLRKDFIVDAYQVDEARAAGADAVLLIAAALAPEALASLRARAATLGMDALVEVHDEAELEVALGAGADLVGINNRDLHTFHTDLAVTERLAPRVPPGTVVVAESGILCHEDVVRLGKAGAHAFLVGESLMRADDVGAALRALRGTS